jgi:hydroxymethylpyrimidine pyrophosphatase-like HAD family hydrolase
MPSAHIAMEEVGVGFWVTEGFPEGAAHGHNAVLDIAGLSARDAVRIVVVDAQAPSRGFDNAMAGLGLEITTFTITGTRWMDIAPEGVTKAYALERLRSLCAVPIGQTFAIGDGDNDVDMLGWAGRGVAMGHAEASVIAAADEVTLSIVDDGAVPVLRSLLGAE